MADIEVAKVRELFHPMTGESLDVWGDRDEVVPVLAEWLEQTEEMIALNEQIRRVIEEMMPEGRMTGRVEGGGVMLSGEKKHGSIPAATLEKAFAVQGMLPESARPIQLKAKLEYKLSRSALSVLRGTAGPNAEAVLKMLDDARLRAPAPKVKVAGQIGAELKVKVVGSNEASRSA
ncbi:MAG: hypothetical protein AAFN74_21765 [Myxococcota bacterium]